MRSLTDLINSTCFVLHFVALRSLSAQMKSYQVRRTKPRSSPILGSPATDQVAFMSG